MPYPSQKSGSRPTRPLLPGPQAALDERFGDITAVRRRRCGRSQRHSVRPCCSDPVASGRCARVWLRVRGLGAGGRRRREMDAFSCSTSWLPGWIRCRAERLWCRSVVLQRPAGPCWSYLCEGGTPRSADDLVDQSERVLGALTESDDRDVGSFAGGHGATSSTSISPANASWPSAPTIGAAVLTLVGDQDA